MLRSVEQAMRSVEQAFRSANGEPFSSERNAHFAEREPREIWFFDNRSYRAGEAGGLLLPATGSRGSTPPDPILPFRGAGPWRSRPLSSFGGAGLWTAGPSPSFGLHAKRKLASWRTPAQRGGKRS